MSNPTPRQSLKTEWLKLLIKWHESEVAKHNYKIAKAIAKLSSGTSSGGRAK